jgi:hypothetical protein
VVEPLQIQPGKLIDSVQPTAFLFISDATQTCLQLSIQSIVSIASIVDASASRHDGQANSLIGKAFHIFSSK